ncbi:MAG: alpha-ketoglutarate-dependent dioxygenase AlkB [Saprospiraceae bacterium]|nr:alpha-ketoglutarate-dependent dioxygenase AlkB [Saprospiraceae bacterium]
MLQNNLYPNFNQCDLDGNNSIYKGNLPTDLETKFDFEKIWNIHPDAYHEIMMHGKMVKTPRWQQAYNIDYQYTGNINKALPLPQELNPFLEWIQTSIDSRLNGVLINWYDGQLDHYIGKHRDSTIGIIAGTSIVTLSFGEERIFRLRPYKSKGTSFFDINAIHGSVIIIPYDTNKIYTHEITKQKKMGRRISLTFRGFDD